MGTISDALMRLIDGTARFAIALCAVATSFFVTNARQPGKRSAANEPALLRHLTNTLPAMIGVITKDGLVIEMNKTALDFVAHNQHNVAGQPIEQIFVDFLSPDQRDQLRTMIAQAATGETSRHTLRLRTGPDAFRMLDLTITPMPEAGGYLAWHGTDITEWHEKGNEVVRLTQSLKHEKQRLEMIIHNIPGIVFVAVGSPENGQQHMAYISDYVRNMLGYAPDTWPSTSNFLRDCIHPDDLEETIRQIKAIFESGGRGRAQFRMIARDGRVLHVESHSTVTKDMQGRPIGACGVIMDMTDRKSAEAQIQRLMEQLRRSNEELEQFAFVASHDLQEPLRKVRSYLQLIEQRYADRLDEDGRAFIAYAVDGAARMRALIQDLLQYSRLQRDEVEFAPVALNEVLRHVRDTLQLQIEDAEAQIVANDLPQVMASERQMAQLLQNLLSNALKFRSDVPPVIRIGVEARDDVWLFSIADNGIGIPSDQYERIFTVFQRLHPSTAYTGTGIGLAICKRIVENHNGRIWVESEAGQGTTFIFTLPRQ